MKITLLGRHFFLLLVLLAITFTLNSCRKDLLVQSPDNLKNALSIAEAKSYFNSHFSVQKQEQTTKLLELVGQHPPLKTLLNNRQPIWDKAYQKMLSTGEAVKIPLDFGKSFAVFGVNKKKGVPFASLNYLLMYKDKKDSIKAEWVSLYPDTNWLLGNRGSYRGKITVRNWNGELKKVYTYGQRNTNGSGPVISNNSIYQVEQSRVSGSTTFSNTGAPYQICIRYKRAAENCTCTDKNNCDWATCDVCGITECDWITPEDPGTEPPTHPPGGTGGGQDDPGGSDGSGSSGGNPGSGDYPPSCDPGAVRHRQEVMNCHVTMVYPCLRRWRMILMRV